MRVGIRLYRRRTV